MTIRLEQLADGSVSDRNFQALMALVPGVGVDATTKKPRSVGIRFGTGTVTWPGASATSNTLTVTHGLGKTPLNVQLTMGSRAGTFYVQGYVSSVGATTFNVNLATLNDSVTPANTDTTTVYWVAIG